MMDVTFKHVVDWGLGTIIDSKRYGVETVPYGYGRYASDATFGHGGSQSSVGFADPAHGAGRGLLFQRHAGRDGPSEAAAPRARRAVRGFGPGVRASRRAAAYSLDTNLPLICALQLLCPLNDVPSLEIAHVSTAPFEKRRVRVSPLLSQLSTLDGEPTAPLE